MQNETNSNESTWIDPWEDKCRELEIRDKATMIFGPLWDRNVREIMVKYGLLFSSDGEHEEWSRLLDASLVADEIRKEMGFSDLFYSDLPATKEM